MHRWVGVVASMVCLVGGCNQSSNQSLPVAPSPSPGNQNTLDDSGQKWDYGRFKVVERWASSVVDPLNKELQSDDAQKRADAIQKVEMLWNDLLITIPRLVDLLHDSDAEVREKAARALRNCNQRPEALPGLRECLDDPDPLVRVRAAEAIYLITGDSQTAVPVLRRALKILRAPEIPSDPDGRARYARERMAGGMANVLLGKMGPSARDALDDLIEIWKENVDPNFARLYARTIAKIDPERAKELGINVDEFARPAGGAPVAGAGGRN